MASKQWIMKGKKPSAGAILRKRWSKGVVAPRGMARNEQYQMSHERLWPRGAPSPPCFVLSVRTIVHMMREVARFFIWHAGWLLSRRLDGFPAQY